MKFQERSFNFFAIFTLLITTLVAGAGTLRTQTITLHKGWNAVFLQVAPTNAKPEAVFGNTPIAVVASYLSANSSVEFIQNPGEIPWDKNGWGVWYAPNRPDNFLSSLAAVDGNRAYLIYSQAEFVWNISGNVALEPMRWKSDSFNFVGFCLDDQSPPTFDKFFSGSSAHRPCKIYQLVSDQWVLVANPVAATMKSGEAYWIYCKGSSDYQGPLKAKIIGQTLTFGDSGENWLLLKNEGSDPLGVQVDTVTPGELPLAYKIRGVSEGSIENIALDLPQHYSLPTLETQQSTALWLKLRRERMTSAAQSTLLKISTDNGVQVWVPVTGTRNDLSANP